MKAKTIKAVLRKKHDDFCESITDAKVRHLVEKNTIITGGSIANMLLGEPVNDYDLYFTNFETTKAVAEYYVQKFKDIKNPKFKDGREIDIKVNAVTDEYVKIMVKSAGVASEDQKDDYQYFETVDPDSMSAEEYAATALEAARTIDEGAPRYRPVYLSSNAITLSQDVQLILRFFGDADKIHENFDFAHCTSYWTSGDGNLVLRPVAMECLLSRELRYIGSKYPIASIVRLRKFIKRNFTINAGQILKICLQISKLNLEDPAVLQDQLTGVDVAYFHQVISYLKEKDATKVDYAYLIEIIDRMF